MKKDFTVIILGSDENAYGNSRLIFEEYGIKPILMCSRRLIPTYFSKISTLIATENFDKADVFVKTLKNELETLHKDFEKVLVVPCADYYTDLLVENYEKFDGLIENKFISKDLLKNLYKKDEFYKLCEKHGLDYPKTYVAKPSDRVNAVENLPFDFPIVVKPENSNAYEYLHAEFEGKKKVFFFSNKEDYLKVINSMNKSDYKGKLIIQEFIEGGDDAGRVVNSYSNNQNQVMASCLGQPVIEEYAPKTLGNYAAIITRSDDDLYKKVSKFLKEIGYVGFSNIDFKYDNKTGRYLAFELNPRLGRSSFFVYSSGLNMMKILIDDVVYKKKFKPVFNKKVALWMNIPKKTIKKFVSNPKIKNECLDLIKKKKAIKTLIYPKDSSFKRNAYMRRYYNIQHNNFENYYFEKSNIK